MEGNNHMGIAVEGSVGVGKTSLATLMHKQLGGEYIKETVEGNPYFEDFYGDTKHTATMMQLYMLGQRLNAYMKISENPLSIYDQSLDFDAGVYAKINWLNGNIENRDYEVYQSLRKLWEHSIVRAEPDLIIALTADDEIIDDRIRHRNRESEQGVDFNYYHELNRMGMEVIHEQQKNEKQIIVLDTNHKSTVDLLPEVWSGLLDYNIINKRQFANLIAGRKVNESQIANTIGGLITNL